MLGAMETGYQRSKIQKESHYYESLKSTGRMPIVGVNTFVDLQADFSETSKTLSLVRATEAEK